MLGTALNLLTCPLCGQSLTAGAGALKCPKAHAFDIARQGYVNLLSGGAHTGTADTAEMVRARADFLAAGHYAPLAEAIARIASDLGPSTVLDAGTGTGYYLAAVLDALPTAVGLGLDISKYALRRAARAHPRAAAAVWDVWRPLPVRSAEVDLVLNVFAPRNAAEFARVLRPEGALLVVTPTGAHLAELRAEAGLLEVDAAKEERLDRTLSGRFEPARTEHLDYPLTLSAAEATDAVAMGPSAHHAPRAVEGDRQVTASFRLSLYRPTPQT
ncbi:putative RNA methyltransferase [Streptomyces sp. RPT161]|uniref:putative RNA methyltransferase n=1 Tax=Streptomyces sp. RPT161 TaxID=3015993 RepID=UPI0022B8966B|nr:methyltransferase domain-containing protein [Streptomyces sp. RPT161]